MIWAKYNILNIIYLSCILSFLQISAVIAQGDPLQISDIRVENITLTSADVTWSTNRPSSSQVEYGTDISYGDTTPLDETLLTSHSVSVTNLEPGTTYHYRVFSVDADDSMATSADSTFTTEYLTRIVTKMTHASQFSTFEVVEITLEITNPRAVNPFLDAVVTAAFSPPGAADIAVKGFCDTADGTYYRIRFTPAEAGFYTYQIEFEDAAGTENFSGSFEVVAGSRKGFITTDPDYPTKFAFSNGGYPFIASKTAWVIAAIPETNSNAFLDKMVTRRENCIRFCMEGYYDEPDIQVDAWPWGGTRDEPDFSTFNVDFWNRLDQVISYAAERNIYAEPVLFMQRPPFLDWEQTEDYLDYLLARLSCYPSIVLFEIWNENDQDYDYQEQMGNYLHQNDPFSHLVTTSHGTTYDAAWPTADWIDVAINHFCRSSNVALSQHYTVATAITQYGKPAWCDETGREIRHGNDDGVHRRKQYWTWNMGGVFWTYHSLEGCEGILNIGYDGPGSEYLRFIRPFWESLDFWRMTPDNSLIRNNPASTYERCAASDSFIVVYLVNETSGASTSQGFIEIDLPAGTYNSSFYNPQNGTYLADHRRYNLQGGETVTLTHPAFTDDIILLIETVDHAPVIEVQPPFVDFAVLPVGETDTSRISVYNRGSSALNVTDMYLTGVDAGDFDIIDSPFSFSLVPGDSQHVYIRFAPSSDDEKFATLIVENNDPNESLLSVSLRGNRIVDEEFDSESFFGYTRYVPKTGPVISLTDNPGYLVLDVPSSTTYDHWYNVDESPQVRRRLTDDDWQVETRLELVLAQESEFHVGLQVYFARYDLFYWGLNGGSDRLVLSRSGQARLIDTPYDGGSAVDLRIRKEGTTYYFDYKTPFETEWINAGSHTTDTDPKDIGLIAKTWSTNHITASFDYLRLEEIIPDVTPPAISSVESSGITSRSVTITWYTDEPATGQVHFGPNTGYGNRSHYNPSHVSYHSHALHDLIPNTTYHYLVRSRDIHDNVAESEDFTFTTLAENATPRIVALDPSYGSEGSEILVTGEHFIGTNVSPIDIMPLGNSLTSGIAGSSDSSGYRNDLGSLLVASGIVFDFVGTLSHGDGFDGHHEGHDGFKTDDLLAGVDSYLTANPPDIVLLHIGTNDISNGSKTPAAIRDEIGDILDAVHAFDPAIDVVLSSLVPRTDAAEASNLALNALIPALVNEKQALGYPVIFADNHAAFLSDPGWQTDYMWNYLHPNDAGYEVMANTFLTAVKTAINRRVSTVVTFNGTPADQVTFDSESQLLAVVPAAATTGPVTVTTDNGPASSPSDFTVDPVTADFEADPTTGYAPHPVQFSDLSTGSVESWEWDFGDDSPASTDQHPQHIYTIPGDYTVTLEVAGGGETSTETKTRYIQVDAPVPVFTDITSSSNTPGYSMNGYGHGISFADVDKDGQLDFYVSNATGAMVTPDLLYMNRDNNQFLDEAALRGTADVGLSHGVVSADFDNDGDLDAYFANMPQSDESPLGRNALYRNNGNGYFTDITGSAGIIEENDNSRSAVALDIEGDGDLDLYTVNWGEPNVLYLNDGSGNMTRVNRGADGPAENPDIYGQQGVTAGDIDNDGDVDIYVCRRSASASYPAPNFLFINDGDGNFTEAAAARGVAVDGRSHGAALADVDNDGDLDLFVVNYSFSGGGLPYLGVFFNNGNGTFADRSAEFDIRVSGYSLVFGDVDNDADLDLYLLRNADKEPGAVPELYLNDGDGHLNPVSNTGLEISGNDVRGGAYGDIDSDGDIDFYVTCTDGSNFLLRNDIPPHFHYIDIVCRGSGGDYGGFGSKVSVFVPGHMDDPDSLLGYQESVSNYGYICQNQTALHFGLGKYATCDIKVVQTDGHVVYFQGVAADQLFEMDNPPPAALEILTDTLPDGEIDSPYTTTLQATGGVAPYSWTLFSGDLPQGLSLLESAGQLTGTPAESGTFTFTVQVEDSDTPSSTDTRALTLVVDPYPELEITTTELPAGYLNVPYTGVIDAQGGKSPYSWTISAGSPPAGLTIDPVTGDLGGTPTATGSSTFTVRVQDDQNPPFETTREYTVNIGEEPVIDQEFVTGSLYGYTVYTPAAGPQFDLTGRPGYLRLDIPSTSAYDHWLTVDQSPQCRRTLSGTDWQVETKVQLSTVDGTKFHVGLMVYFSRFNLYYWGFNGSTGVLKMSRTGFGGLLNVNYSGGNEVELRIRKEGTTYYFDYRAPGAPEWTTAGSENYTTAPVDIGVIGKTWEAIHIVADFDYLRLQTAGGPSPLQITTSSLASGQVGIAYSAQLTAQGGVPPYTWSLEDGTLPVGLTLVPATGQLSGTPSGAGDYTFTLDVSDSQSPAEQVSRQFTVTITAQQQGIDEEFDESLEGYTQYIPKDGPSFSLTDRQGFLRMTVPGSNRYDHWLTVDDAPQLRRPVGSGDWQIETKLELTAVNNTRFHVGLLVYFSRYDVYYWGFNSDVSTLKLSRSGFGGLISASYGGGKIVELRIRREGDKFYFEFRAPGAGEWTVAGTQTTEDTPTAIGLIGKTWANMNVVADLDYLRLVADGGLTLVTSSLPAGSIGVPYNSTLQASGGVTPYEWSIDGQLPAGLSLNAETGVISGTPTAAGTSSFTVTVTDGDSPPSSQNKALSITIDAIPPLEITTTTLAGAYLGQPYSASLQVQGGLPPYTWSIHSGSLPDSLELNAATGQISGKTAAEGTFEFTVRVADSQNPVHDDTQSLTLSVSAQLPVDQEFTSGSLDGYTVHIPVAGPTISAQARAGYLRIQVPPDSRYDHWTTTDHAPHIRRDLAQEDWQVETTCELVNATGEGYHVGLIVYFSQFDMYYWGYNSKATILKLSRSGYGGLLAVNYTGGNSVDLQIRKSNTTYYFEYKAHGAADWILAGTQSSATQPTAVGLICKTWKNINVTADFDYLRMGGGELTLITSALSTGQVGLEYNTTLQASGGVTPYHWSFVGDLPDGLSLDANSGQISGTPTAAGTSSFTVTVTDSDTPPSNRTRPFELIINPIPPLVIETSSVPACYRGVAYSTPLTAAGGLKPYSWTVSDGALPAGLSLDELTGVIAGTTQTTGDFTFTVRVTDSRNPAAQDTQELTLSVTEPPAFDEEFESGILAGCTVYVPKAGPQFDPVGRPGYLRLTVPKTGKYDHWLSVDDAPQLRRTVTGENWQVETSCELISTGGELYHVGLIVYFSVNDLFYWGFNRSTGSLKLSRSGFGGLISVNYEGGSIVELRIRKESTLYHFEYRQPGNADWIAAGTQTTPTPAVEVGLIAKTWDFIDFVADFDYLRLTGEGGGLGKGIAQTTGDQPPTSFSISQGYPNPFNPETHIRISLPEASHVSVRIYNIRGQFIRDLTETSLAAGFHDIVWDGMDDRGITVNSGPFYFSIRIGDRRYMRKVMFIK